MDKIEEFLLNYTAKSTVRTYRSFLKRYFNVIDADPNSYFSKDGDYQQDVKLFWRDLQSQPPKTIFSGLSAVRVFLSENEIELPMKFWRNLRNRTKGNRAVTDDIIPTPKQLKKILDHGDVRGQSFFLSMVSSGLRIGELCQIKLNDVDFSTEPTTISVRAEYTKTGNKRKAFISKEATEKMKAWLKHRDSYLNAAVKRAKVFEAYYNRENKKTTDDKRIYPFSTGTARDVWNRLLENSEFNDKDETTKFYKMHPHVLRKYFRTYMTASGVPLDVVESLMGHEGYLTECYRKYNMDQLREMYLQGELAVTVFEGKADLTELNKSMNEKDAQIKELLERQKIMELKMDIMENRLEIEKAKNGKK